ncbi:MAG TPA: hypothetical protein VI319_00710 [Burkholderiales bacterium]
MLCLTSRDRPIPPNPPRNGVFAPVTIDGGGSGIGGDGSGGDSGSGISGQQAYVKASNTDSNDEFGFAIALSGDGSTMAVGAYGEASTFQ